MTNAFIPHFEQCALVSLEKQFKLLKVTGEHFINIDIEAGCVQFNDLSFPFQVLGTESDNTLTWLWAWAEEQTELPQDIIRSADEMKTWLERNNLKEYISPSIDLDCADGLQLSLVACEVCRADAFYRDHYDGGSLFILLFDEKINRQQGFDKAGFMQSLMQIVERYDFNHRNAFISYFHKKGLQLAESATYVNGQLETGERIIAEFNGNGKITSINGELLDLQL